MSSAEPGLLDEPEPTDEARRLRVLFDSLPALIGYWDRDLHNVVANAAYVDWFGIDPETMRGRHLRDIIGEVVYAQNLPYIELALEGDEQQFQRTLVDPAGRTRYSQVTYVPDVVDDQAVGLFVMVTDVTQRVEAERELADAQELAEVGSWTLVPSTRQIFWSAQMYRIMGLLPEQFTPAVGSVLPQVHPEDRERVREAVQRAGSSGVGYELSYRIVRPDEQVREVHSRVRTERGADGAVTRLTGVTQDVTSSNRMARELGTANEELRQVNRLNADVLGVVGHDARAPLGLVLGHLEMLSDSWEEWPEEMRATRVEKALGAARRLSTLLDDILAMANFESGTIATRPIRVSLGEVVLDALTSIQGGLEVRVDRAGDPVAVIDPFHLRQIVVNLVTNAQRHGAAPVVVTLAQHPTSATVVVADGGEGVPAHFVPHLFERFRRSPGEDDTQRAGSGFGLYIVGRLAEANGCRVSYSPGDPGSRFHLEIPHEEQVTAS